MIRRYASRPLAALVAFVLVALCGLSVFAAPRTTLPTVRTSADVRAQPSSAPLPVPVSPFIQKILPPWPKRPGGKGTRRVLSASGASITVTPVAGCTQPAGSDIYPVGCQVTIKGTALPNSGANNHQDYVQVPNTQTAVATLGVTYTSNADVAHNLTFATPGVYIVGVLNSTGGVLVWDAVIYIAVGTPNTFDTFADSGLTTPSQHFIANGSNVIYLSAAGLTPTDKYVYTVENNSDNGKCVFTAPQQASYATANLLCNPEAAGLTGSVPSNGVFNAQWQPTFGTPAALQVGTYSVTLYDQTIHQRISQRLVSLASAVGGTPAATVQFYPNGALFAGVAGETTPRIAYNGNGAGYNDSAVTFVNVYNGATGLVPARTYLVTVTDPQGNVVFKQANAASAGGTLAGNLAQYGLPTTTLVPLATIAAGNVYVTSVYDQTTNTTVASQAWQVLNYSTLPTFSNGTNQLQATQGAGNSTNASITYQNDGDVRFGAGNADSISKIVVTTSAPFMTLACTTACPSTVTDSDHQTWNVTLAGTQAAGYTLTMTAPAGKGLRPGSSLNMPLTVTALATVKCPSNNPCTMTTSITPLHNGIGSGNGNSYIVSSMQVTDNGGDHSGTIVTEVIGNTANGTQYQLLPAYTPYTNTHLGTYFGAPYANQFAANAYAAGEPYTAPAGSNIYGFAVVNTSTNAAARFNAVAMTLPPGIDASKVVTAGAVFTFAGVPNTTFTVTNCGGANGLPANTFCISNWNGVGTQIAPNQLFYCFVTLPQSTVPFPYSPVGGIIYNGDQGFGHLIDLTADGVRDVFVPKTSAGSQIPANSIGAYSLTASQMLATVTPGSLGTNLNNNVTLSFQNTPFSSDPFPDYVDGVLVEVPTPGAGQPVSNLVVQNAGISPSGWQFLNGQSSFVNGGHTYYWFGLCSNQYDVSYALPERIAGLTRGGDAPAGDQCPQSPNEQLALQPGQSMSIPLRVITTGNAGAYTGYIFAHGANGNGWSSGTAFTLNVATGTAASAGFSGLGTYRAGDSTAALTPGTQPSIGGDSDATFGNSYSYTVTNTGNNGLGKIDITIPGTTSTGAPGADSSAVYPTLTPAAFSGTLSYSGGNGSGGCAISNYTSSSSQNANDGILEIGGAGCTINPGDSVTVNFSMKMPYRVNVIYDFPTAVYSKAAPATKVAAGETWVNDSTLTITNSAVLSVNVNAGATCAGSVGASVNTMLNLLNFGAIAPSSSATCTQAVTASVWTPLASPYGWSLYASIDNNPVRTPGAGNVEALMRYSAAGSTLQDPAVSGGSAVYTNIPTTAGAGGFIVGKTTGTGTASSYRTPYVFMTDYQISIGTEAVAQQQHTLTFTWISN